MTVRAWTERPQKEGECVLEKRKASSPLHTGHKSSGWVMLFYSLPFAVPTHSCVAAKVKINMLFLVCCVSGRVRNSKSEGALERQSVHVHVCVCVCVCM